MREVIADREPYLVGEVEELGDALGDEEAAEELVGRVTRRFVDYLRLLQPRDGEDAEPIDVQVEVEVPDDVTTTRSRRWSRRPAADRPSSPPRFTSRTTPRSSRSC